MTKKIALYSLFILFGTFISACSQVMLKKAANKTYPNKIKEYANPLVVSAYMVFILATFCSIVAYKWVPLSLGPILESTSYIYVTVFGVKIFHEKINKEKIFALVLIISGIVVAAA